MDSMEVSASDALSNTSMSGFDEETGTLDDFNPTGMVNRGMAPTLDVSGMPEELA